MNSANYSLCSVTKRMSMPQEKVYYSLLLYVIIDIRDFMTYFSRDFQFQDLHQWINDFGNID